MGNATDEIFKGIMGKIAGTATGIDFGAVDSILSLAGRIVCYQPSVLLSSGMYYDGRVDAGDISFAQRYYPQKINRMP